MDLMDPNQALAGSDEMLLRCLCAAYAVARERNLDINDPDVAAVLMAAAMRFAAVLAKAHGASLDWFADRARMLMGEVPIEVKQDQDPGVRRWINVFRETYGPEIPAAFALRGKDQPLH